MADTRMPDFSEVLTPEQARHLESDIADMLRDGHSYRLTRWLTGAPDASKADRLARLIGYYITNVLIEAIPTK